MGLPSGSVDLEDCPVPEKVLRQLLDAAVNASFDIGPDLPETKRAELAVFCYRRAHLRQAGLVLAGQCNREALVREAGTAGEVIYTQSRQSSGQTEELRARPRGYKSPVSLRVV